MKLANSIFSSVFLYIVFALTAFPQSDSGKKAKESDAHPIVVRTNVAVLDVNGKLLDNIKIEDIKIYEDGVEQKLTYFERKEPNLNLGLVIDNTGSMRKNLDEVIALRSNLTDLFLPSNGVFLTRFVGSEQIEIIQDWTTNKADLVEALSLMHVAGGQSAVLDAIYLSAEKLLERQSKAPAQRYAIVLISDVEERESYYDLGDVLNLIKKTDLQIFILSFAENAPLAKKKARSLGAELALETGGTIYSLPEKHKHSDIIAALQKIAGELRSQYIVGYTPVNQKRDGLQRKLSVEVTDGPKGEKRYGIIRETYAVPKR